MNLSHEITTCPADAVFITAALEERNARRPDYAAEAQALTRIVEALGSSPATVLQKLASVALEFCDAHSSGISLLRTNAAGDQEFYWPAIAGRWQHYIGGTTPRHHSPCGVVLDEDSAQLASRPERCYLYLAPADPPLVEVLLAPFYVDGQVTGTVWAVSHDETRQFDAEDSRRLQSIALCATAAHQVALSLDVAAVRPTAVAAVQSHLARVRATARPDTRAALSTREREVVRRVAEGHTNQAIADRLGVSIKTVETYRARASNKLGAPTRAELVRYAAAQGWLS